MTWWNLLRLRRPQDWVHRELAFTLKRTNVELLPLLVDDEVQMPSRDSFPWHSRT